MGPSDSRRGGAGGARCSHGVASVGEAHAAHGAAAGQDDPLEIRSVAPGVGAPWGGGQGGAFLGGAGGAAALRSLVVPGGAAPSQVARGAPALVAFLGG